MNDELIKWQSRVDDYFRQWIHQLATVERVVEIKNGPLAKEAVKYDRDGMRGVDLAALLRGIEAVASSKTAHAKWNSEAFTAWGKHRERIQRYIDTKPGAKTKKARKVKPKLPPARPVPPAVDQKHGSGETVTPVKKGGLRVEPKEPKPPVVAAPVVSAPKPKPAKVVPPPEPEREIKKPEPKEEPEKPRRRGRRLLSWLPWNR